MWVEPRNPLEQRVPLQELQPSLRPLQAQQGQPAKQQGQPAKAPTKVVPLERTPSLGRELDGVHAMLWDPKENAEPAAASGAVPVKTVMGSTPAQRRLARRCDNLVDSVPRVGAATYNVHLMASKLGVGSMSSCDSGSTRELASSGLSPALVRRAVQEELDLYVKAMRPDLASVPASWVGRSRAPGPGHLSLGAQPARRSAAAHASSASPRGSCSGRQELASPCGADSLAAHARAVRLRAGAERLLAARQGASLRRSQSLPPANSRGSSMPHGVSSLDAWPEVRPLRSRGPSAVGGNGAGPAVAVSWGGPWTGQAGLARLLPGEQPRRSSRSTTRGGALERGRWPSVGERLQMLESSRTHEQRTTVTQGIATMD